MEVNTSAFSRRDALIIISTAFISAILLIGTSVWGTTIGTNIDATGTVGAATGTPWGTLAVDQVAGAGSLKPVFVVGDNGTTTPTIFVSQKGIIAFGSSTPSPLFLNQGDVVVGRNGSTNDLYVSGGLGVANATTSDGDFIVGDGSSGLRVLSFTKNGRFVVGATSTALSSTGAPDKFVFDGGAMSISSGGTGTTTLSIVNEAAANGTNACIEMSADGVTYRVFINNVRTGLLVEQGSCMNP